MESKRIDHYAKLSSRCLDVLYHYGEDLDTTSFGWRSNCMSVEAALQYISGRQTDNQTVDVEIASSAVHDGWAKAARTEWDERKYGAQGASKLTAKGVFDNSAFTTEQGLAKYQARLKLAKTRYTSLSEDEKEKDRAVVEALLLDLQTDPLTKDDYSDMRITRTDSAIHKLVIQKMK